MGLLDRIRRAFNKHKVSKLKKKIARFDMEITKQGKKVETMMTVLCPRSHSRSRFEYVLSDSTTNKQPNTEISTKNKKSNRVVPLKKCPTNQKKASLRTLVGRSCNYDEKCVWAEEYDPGVYVFLVVRKDGVIDILKFTWSDGLSKPKRTIWWIENKEKVCKRFNVTAMCPPEEPLISLWTYNLIKNTFK